MYFQEARRVAALWTLKELHLPVIFRPVFSLTCHAFLTIQKILAAKKWHQGDKGTSNRQMKHVHDTAVLVSSSGNQGLGDQGNIRLNPRTYHQHGLTRD